MWSRSRPRLNFEAPADAGDNNQYNFIVTASDGTLSDDQAVAITVANVNEAPTITSGATGSIAENAATSTVAYDANAADVDANTTLTYSLLTGGDAAAFNIDPATGEVTLKASADFETKASYTITVRATDNGNPVLFADQAVTINVTNVNEAPVITSGATGSIAENAATSTVAYDANAADVDANTTLTYSLLAGGDAAAFDIDPATGEVTLKASADFETKASYTITVRATDNGNPVLFADQAVTINVTNVNEAPVITSGATATVDENQTAAYTATASDPDAGDTLTYSLSGADADLFNISATGVVTFKVAPDFEAPADDNGDNDYEITVRATDAGGLSDDQAVTISVADVQEKLIIDLTSLSAAQGFIIQGDAAGDLAGFSVSAAGDVNGDGFDDLIVGARGGDDGGTDAGEAYVVFGSASGFGR